MKMKTVKSSAKHLEFRDKLIAFVRTEMADSPPHEILAIFAYTTGQIVAMQDQRTMTPSMAMTLVEANILDGNRSAVSELSRTSNATPN